MSESRTHAPARASAAKARAAPAHSRTPALSHAPAQRSAIREILGPGHVQAKLRINPPGDRYEREADAVASGVVGGGPVPRISALPSAPAAPPPSVQPSLRPAAPGEPDPPEPDLQSDLAPVARRETLTGTGDDSASRTVGHAARAPAAPLRTRHRAHTAPSQGRRAAGRVTHHHQPVQRSTRRSPAQARAPPSSGEPSSTVSSPGVGSQLRANMRFRLESRLGVDLSGVRVHEGRSAHRAAGAINARAFTHGNHIWLGRGESQSDSRLMAHEVTHVVQQGAAGPNNARAPPSAPVQRLSIFGFDIGDLISQYLPASLASAVREIASVGIVEYLGSRISTGFQRLFGGLTGDSGPIDSFLGLFEALAPRVSEIVAALASGHCEPLFNAVRSLGATLGQIAGDAWNGLVQFFSPVKDFFVNLWDRFGTPLVSWIGEVAGDAWAAIQALGRDLWNFTQPIRDFASLAWDAFTSYLGIGGSDGADSGGGVLGWVQDKAQQAWDSIKATAAPVIEPIRGVIDQIIQILPLDAILNLRATILGWLGGALSMVDQMQQPAGVTANQDVLRDVVLPGVVAAIGTVKTGLTNAGAWVSGAITGIASRINSVVAAVASVTLLAPLRPLLDGVSSVVARVSAWAVSGLGALIAGAGAALDKLAQFAGWILEMLVRLVEVVGDLAGRIGGFVTGPLFSIIPECILTPVKDFLINQILARIPVLNQILQLPDIWARIRETAMQVLLQIFQDGNLIGAVWTIFTAILSAFGLPPELVTTLLANMLTAIGDVLADPFGFIINLLRAVKMGFEQFFGNILTHLLNGAVNWLLGKVAQAGITSPADLSLGSILGMLFEILGLTLDNLLERLALKIGPEKVELIRNAIQFATGAWEWIKAIFTEGPAAIWRFLQEQLSNLWSIVLDAAISWITEKIMTEATVKLLSFLDPSGIMAVVNSLIAIYRAVQSFLEHLREMLEIVNSVAAAAVNIARGVLEVAATGLENALASSLPIAIDFLANQVGLGNLGDRLAEVVGAVRERINAAIDWLIDGAIGAGQAFLDALSGGAGPDAAAAPVEGTPDERKTAAIAHLTTLLRDGEEGASLHAALPQIQARFGLTRIEVDHRDPDNPRILLFASPPDAVVLATTQATAGPEGSAEVATTLAPPTAQTVPTPYGAVFAVYGDNTVAEKFSVHEMSWPRPVSVTATIGSQRFRNADRPSLITDSGKLGTDEAMLATGTASPYDGGHLVALVLAGPRANVKGNIAPQNASFNRGTWRGFEGLVDASPVLATNPDVRGIQGIEMAVSVTYGGSRTISVAMLKARKVVEPASLITQPVTVPARVPSRWRMEISVLGDDANLVLAERTAGASTVMHAAATADPGQFGNALQASDTFRWYKEGSQPGTAITTIGGKRRESLVGVQSVP